MPDLLISLMMEHNPTITLLATLLEDLIIHIKQLVDDIQSNTNVSSTGTSSSSSTSSFGRKRNGSYTNRSSWWKNIRRQKQQQCNEHASTLKSSETTLILQLYIRLIHYIGIGSDLCPGSGPGSGSRSTFVITIMNYITNVCKRCKEEEIITNRARNLISTIIL